MIKKIFYLWIYALKALGSIAYRSNTVCLRKWLKSADVEDSGFPPGPAAFQYHCNNRNRYNPVSNRRNTLADWLYLELSRSANRFWCWWSRNGSSRPCRFFLSADFQPNPSRITSELCNEQQHSSIAFGRWKYRRVGKQCAFQNGHSTWPRCIC